ncbi:MAG: site-2 protease family protein [Thermomicrobiales bacterium]|nr:site-2 protease family protein [Thermomicrobiales bacterium]
MTNRSTQEIVYTLVSFVIAITIHEFMHAYTAHRLGDDTAKRLGRITINPIMHFDPIGFFGMVMIAMGYPFIGWGKPVPVQPGNFRGYWSTHRKEGMLLVAAAGPISNILQAMVAAVPFQILWRNGSTNWDVLLALQTFIYVNLLLAAFNLIPIPPLDGYRILTGILPSFWTKALQPLEQYGFMVLILFMFMGNRVGGTSIISAMTSPVITALQHVVYAGLI